MVLPRSKFLNLMVVLAAPRACFIIEKLSTLCGSPSISMVIPFLMSDVSTATASDVLERDEGETTNAELPVRRVKSKRTFRIIMVTKT